MLVRLANKIARNDSGKLGLTGYITIEAPRLVDGKLYVKIKPINYRGKVIEQADELDVRTFYNIEGDI